MSKKGSALAMDRFLGGMYSGGWTALHSAARDGDVSGAILSLKQGCSPVQKTRKTEWTGGMSSLELASRNGHPEVLKLLLDFCPSGVGVEDAEDLMIAAARGGNGCVEMVAAAGLPWMGSGERAFPYLSARRNDVSLPELDVFVTNGFPKDEWAKFIFLVSSVTRDKEELFDRMVSFSSDEVKISLLWKLFYSESERDLHFAERLFPHIENPYGTNSEGKCPSGEFPDLFAKMEASFLSKSRNVSESRSSNCL